MVIHSGVTQKAICVHRAGLASNWDFSPAKVSVGARLGEAVQEGLPCGGLPRAAENPVYMHAHGPCSSTWGQDGQARLGG